MENQISAKIVALLIGLFYIFSSVMKFDWFLGSGRNGRLLKKAFGKEGLRNFYMIFGIIITVCSLMFIIAEVNI